MENLIKTMYGESSVKVYISVIHKSAVGSFSKFFMLLGPNTLSKILTPITFNSNFSILLGKMA